MNKYGAFCEFFIIDILGKFHDDVKNMYQGLIVDLDIDLALFQFIPLTF